VNCSQKSSVEDVEAVEVEVEAREEWEQERCLLMLAERRSQDG